MTFGWIEAPGGGSIGTCSTGRDTIGRGSLYLAVARVESPVSALFLAFRVFLVFVRCFGAEGLGLFIVMGSFSFLPTLRATIPLVLAPTALAPLPLSSRDSFDSSDSISCRRSVTFA